jgi:hypothetical protein
MSIMFSFGNIGHASCTCLIERVDDMKTVVDSTTRPIVMKGSRVVYVGAFALLPAGHPRNVVYALVEKIAEDIKKNV